MFLNFRNAWLCSVLSCDMFLFDAKAKNTNWNVRKLRQNVRKLRQNVRKLRQNVRKLRQNVQKLRQNVRKLRQNVRKLRKNVRKLRQNVRKLRQNVRKLRQNLKLNSPWDSLTRKYCAERPFVNNHYVNATLCITCEHRFQEDHCLWTARARMLGCLLMETRSCRKNRNTTLRHGNVFWWKLMLLTLHSRWCWSSTPHRRANNALAMRFSVLYRNACCC
jgi:cell division protein FtsB